MLFCFFFNFTLRYLTLTQSTLSSYENGNASPSYDVLLTIVKKYNISLDWLFGISDKRINLSTLDSVTRGIRRNALVKKECEESLIKLNENKDENLLKRTRKEKTATLHF